LKTFRAINPADPLQRAIEQAANDADPFVEMQILHAEPSRVRAGMVCYFDGTDFNPGSGEGIYRRDVANAAWVFLG
jgi:hypothetical protein